MGVFFIHLQIDVGRVIMINEHDFMSVNIFGATTNLTPVSVFRLIVFNKQNSFQLQNEIIIYGIFLHIFS